MNLLSYIIRLADNNLILGHRLSEWCGHGPFLEQDMAMTNISLDLIGQSRSMYALAAEIKNQGESEDDIAFLRLEHEYQNLLLVEQPNGDFAHTVLRQLFFSSFQLPLYQAMLVKLQGMTEEHFVTLRGILEKAVMEVTYHKRWSSEWVIRLGDGTEESHSRMEAAVNDLYRYYGEAFISDEVDEIAVSEGYGVKPEDLKAESDHYIKDIFNQANLNIPVDTYMQRGGKQGVHSEYMGYLLSELQYMQRAYPNANW
jgi:ring-1,2-phenylacetyl-CoA epoxidase subunit PaaC